MTTQSFPRFELDLDKINALPAFDPADHLESEEMIAIFLAEFANSPANEQAAAQEIAARARARLNDDQATEQP
jgi:DNA-binding phage protein